MRTLDYRFFFIQNGQRVEVLPVFNDDMALEYERETNEQFFRLQYSGNMSFVGDTYDYIMTQPFDTTFILLMQHRNKAGVWSDVHTSEFNITDCTVNVDDKRITVKPRTRDEYTAILEGMEREYNLVELAPAITPVTIAKRPMLQIYIQGESVLSCFHGNMWWESEVAAEEDISKLTGDFHFNRSRDYRQFDVTHPFIYIGSFFGFFPSAPNQTFDVTMENGLGQKLHMTYAMTGGGGALQWTFTAELINASDSHLIASYQQVSNNIIDTSSLDFDMNNSYHIDTTTRILFSRVLCDSNTVSGQSTYQIAEDDFCYDNRNYRRVAPYTLGSTDVVSSTNTQAAPTEYGLAPNGQYYVRPNSLAYPIAKTTWNTASVWYDGTFSGDSKGYVVRTCYKIDAVIAVLLAVIAPSISHLGTTAYSQFLYSTTNPVTSTDFHPVVITPKSNILAGENSEPAMKAPITLRQVLNMLRDVFGCYWHVDNGKFCIEHIKYYKNGGSYSSTPSVGVDLTTLTEPRNGKKWGWGVNEYTFEKVTMPERYQYEWMDDVSEPFEGKPIVIKSKYVEQAKIEEVNIGGFTSDIDYMLLAPENISKDGFALMGCSIVSATGDYYVPVNYIAGWSNYVIQNPYMAMAYLQPSFLLYDMPAWTVEVNGVETNANGIQRKKRQKVVFPVGDDVPNTLELVRTYIGEGSIVQMSLSLSSRNVNITLGYDTVQQSS